MCKLGCVNYARFPKSGHNYCTELSDKLKFAWLHYTIPHPLLLF